MMRYTVVPAVDDEDDGCNDADLYPVDATTGEDLPPPPPAKRRSNKPTLLAERAVHSTYIICLYDYSTVLVSLWSFFFCQV